ncbi:hypothetical protein [Leptospira santarosai]|uniref:Uncharacterized protein n=1 Tax=Leptospira santarosai str. MOR084 TaxID=1049984 RepID=A0A0E2B9Y8_9LEPT|nr:hypothetical protein [Leptospira santarosai]EKO32017.1 hypothetical protein LEP1GSC179_0687 [Leptospira santarosai str. MOR084]
MNLVNRISFIGALLAALHTTNCLSSVKPTYTVDKLESDIKPKAEIWTPQGFTQNREDINDFFKILQASIETIKYKETDANKVQVYTYEKYEQSNEILGLIGIVNACILIPCRFSNEYSLTLQYVVDSDVKKEEEYKENKTLWVWLPLGFYNLFTSKSDRNEFLNSGFRRILTDVGPNIANSVMELEKENKHLLNEKHSKENSEWEKVNKNSLKEIIEFNKKAPPSETKDKAKVFLSDMLDKKVQLYLTKNFPFVKSYLMNDLIDIDGSHFEHKFYHIFRGPILGRNPDSGFKVETHLSQKDGKIIWRIDAKNETHSLYFIPYKKNMTLEKIISKKDGSDDSLSAQETYVFGKHIFDTFGGFPEYSHTDIEFLEKVR